MPPEQETQPQPTPSPTATSAYISNPFGLLMPSWRAIWLNARTWFKVALFFVLPIALILLLAFGFSGPLALVAPLAILLVLVLFIPLLRLVPITIALQLAGARGRILSFGDAYSSTKGKTIRLLLLGFLVGLIVIGGLVALVVPGIIFSVWFSLAFYVYIDENLGIIDSLKRSRELAKGRFFDVAGVVFFTSAISIFNFIPFLGVLTALVGVVIGIMYQAAPAIRYVQLKDAKSSNQALPAVHPLNYAVLVLGILATGLSWQASISKNGGLSLPSENTDLSLPQN